MNRVTDPPRGISKTDRPFPDSHRTAVYSHFGRFSSKWQDQLALRRHLAL